MMFITLFICSVVFSSMRCWFTSEINKKWIEGSFNLLSFLIKSLRFWYMCSVMKGTTGLINTLTLNNTSKRTLRLISILWSSIYPFILGLFNLTYQLVRFYKNLMSWGTTLYSLYSSIYFLTLLIRIWRADWIHLSVTLKWGSNVYSCSVYVKFLLVRVSHFEIFWIKNL